MIENPFLRPPERSEGGLGKGSVETETEAKLGGLI